MLRIGLKGALALTCLYFPATGQAQDLSSILRSGGIQEPVSSLKYSQYSAPAAGFSASSLLLVGGALGVLALAAGGASGGDKDSGEDEGIDYDDIAQIASNDILILSGNGVSTGDVQAAIFKEQRASAEDLRRVSQSADFAANRALRNSGALNRIALGYSGKNIRIGVFDTGIDFTNRNLDGANQGGSFAYGTVWGSGFLSAENAAAAGHGTNVAQVIAGDVGDDNYARGVAPDAILYDMKVMNEQGTTEIGGMTMRDTANFAVAQDLDIINMSVSMPNDEAIADLGSEARRYFNGAAAAALDAATSQGTIFVVSSGNDGLAATNNILAGMGLLDEAAGHVITVAALTEDGRSLATFSNGCGQAKAYCLAATGQYLPVLGTQGEMSSFSGTSAAAPLVSGSLALLLEEFPELSAAEVTELLLATADDVGEVGIDETYGRGVLNLDRAQKPVGEVRIVSGNSVNSAVITSGVKLDASMAGMISKAAQTQMIVLDDFNRGFNIPASEIMASRGREAPISELVIETPIGPGGHLIFAGEDGVAFRHKSGWGLGHIEAELLVPRGASVMSRGYSPLASMGVVDALTYHGKNVDAGLGYGSEDQDSLGIWAGKNMQAGSADFGIMAGYIRSKDGILGSDFGAGTGHAGFVKLSYRLPLSESWSLHGDYSLAKAHFTGEAGLVDAADVMARSISVGASWENAAGGILSASLGTPMTAYSGQVDLDIPVARDPSYSGGPSDGVIRSNVGLDSKTRAPLDIGLSYRQVLAERLDLNLAAVHRIEEDEKENYLGLNMRLAF